MSRTTEQLVGRTEELEAVSQAIAEVAGGRSGVLCVAGAPGIGKSRLLSALAAQADAEDQLVLSGTASELERDLPFGIFVDAMDEYLESLDPRKLSRLDEDVRAELARVFPALSGLGSDVAASPQPERYRTHRAVRTLLETLASQPLVVVLDDLHWADAASIELTSALLRRPPTTRVLVVLGFRPRQLDSRLTAELVRAQRDGALTQLDLGPLTAADARELLGDGVAPAAAVAIYEESGGVPFYLEQLARAPNGAAAARTRAPVPSSLDGTEVPPLVIAALADELSLLSAEARQALQGAAVAGDPFEPELAAAAADLDETDTFAALDDLLRLDFIRATDVPRRFRFRHPLVRRAVYETAPGGWRLIAHERAARALAERGASAAARAHHVELSARQGDAAAVALLREAGDLAAERAPATAARWFDGALRLLPDSAPAQERVEILLARAQALAAVGRLRDSHAALEECLAVVPADAFALRARAATACATVERFLGSNERASERLLRALDEAPEGSPEEVTLLLELALDGFLRVTVDGSESWPERAIAAAEALGDPAMIAGAHAAATLTATWAGDADAGEAARANALPLVDRLTDAELASRLDAAANLAAAELYLDRFPEASRHAQRALDIGRATGQSPLFPPLYAILGTTLWLEGRPKEAADLLDGAVEAARLLDDDQGLAWMLFNRSAPELALGDLDAALATARESIELCSGLDAGLVTAWAGVWLARVLIETGDARSAAEGLLESAGGEEFVLIPGGWRVLCFETLVQARIELGDEAGARSAAGHAEARAAEVGLPYAAVMAERTVARVELAFGDRAVAAERALASVEKAERLGARFDAALARGIAGQALGAAGDRERAVQELTRASADLAAIGSVRYRDAADRELRKLGETVRRRGGGGRTGDSGFASLTQRELEIARLTVDRLTNREIAARLFLSEKTIETHMRNLFGKLGVSSRVEVARATERADRETG